MEVSTKELRKYPGRILEQASRGADIVVTFRGKRVARLVPLEDSTSPSTADASDELCGLWAAREDMSSVEDWVRHRRRDRAVDH